MSKPLEDLGTALRHIMEGTRPDIKENGAYLMYWEIEAMVNYQVRVRVKRLTFWQMLKMKWSR